MIKIVIKTILPEVYFLTLRNCHTRYATVRSLDILTHLHATYIMLEGEDIQAIDRALKALINGKTHFEDFIAHIKDHQESVTTQNPYTTGKILSIAYTLVLKAGLYPLECKECRRKEAPEKTWTTFKVYFSRAFNELRKERANSRTQAYTANVEIC